MVFAVALILSITAAAASPVGSLNSCVLQKNTAINQYKLSTLNNVFGEILTTESNGNIYIVSICRPIPQLFYDPRKLSGAIKLTAKGHTTDLGHIDQSNVIVNDNSIVLTYDGGDRDREVEDTCKGQRWTTYLAFLCDPLATQDILTLIDEDPDQPEICQVWFEVKTSKICDRQPNIPLHVLEKDVLNNKIQTDEREFTKSNELHFRKIEHDIEKINNNNKALNIANEVKPRINDLDKKISKSFSNDNYSTGKENNTINEEIENGRSTQIVSKDHWYQNKKLSDSEKEDKYFNEYKKSLNDKNFTYENNPSKEEAKESNSKKNTFEDKNLVENMKNQPESNKNSSHYENIEHNGSKYLKNKFTYSKINKTVPGGILSNNDYSYPKKNETILHYNNLKNILNQNKNSEGKYENSILNESEKYNQNQNGPEGATYNDTKYKKPIIDNANHTETTSILNTFENKSSNKELNDSGANKIPSGSENKLNRDYSKNSNYIGQRTYNTTLSSNNEIKYKTANEGTTIVDTSNQSQPKDDKSIVDDNKTPGGVLTQHNTNQTYSQKNYPESKLSQNAEEKNEIKSRTNVNDSTIEGTPHENSENKPIGDGDKSVNSNDIDTKNHNTSDDSSMIDMNEKNIKNNYNTTSGSDNNNIAFTIRPTENSPSNTVVNDYKTRSGKINGLSTESPVDSSSNNIKIIDKSELNGTIINKTDNVKNSIQPDQSKSEPIGDLSDDNKSDNFKTTADSSNQLGNGIGFGKLFSKIFPNGVNFSPSTIIGALALLVVVIGVVGAVINRYYYKRSGTDIIPFKGTLQSIFNFIKIIITTIFCCSCCGGRGSGVDLEASDSMNEKTPLLKPTFSTPKAVVVDETSQKSKTRNTSNDDGKQQRKDSTDNNDSDKTTSNNEYGSCMSNESKLNESLEKYAQEKLIKIENNFQGKSIKEVINGKIKTVFTEKIKPTFDSILEKLGKKVEITEEMKNNLNSISNDAALISKFLEKEKSTKNIDEVRANVEVKSKKPDSQFKNVEKPILNVEQNKENVVQNIVEISKNVDIVKAPNNSEKTHSNEIESDNAVVEEQIKSITVGESQQSPNVKPLSEEIVSKDVSKTYESKLKFLGLKKEDENVPKVVKDESIVSDKKVEDNEDEVIEEVIYIDGTDGDEGEEIIEEITETTTIENSPETLDEFNFSNSQSSAAGPGHTTVTTVKTTRKISSSSAPGQVTTVEETVVTDGKPESERKKSSFQFDMGKSGVSMSVGDKKLEIGKAGLKLKRSKSTSPQNVEGDEPDKRDTKSPEKSKRSIPNLKIFKRSISQPTDDDIEEVEGESQQSVSASGKKMSRTGSGLLNFGKSRSKTSLVAEAVNDITVNTNAMLNFEDNERKGLLSEFDKTDGNVEVVRKISTTTSGGNVVSESILETVTAGSAPAERSTKNANVKSNVKTKREKKDKTKVTRPF